MQFTGHSLPVHQSMSVPWEFFTSSHFICQFPPTRFPLITAIRMCYFLPVHHLGLAFFFFFCRIEGQKYNKKTVPFQTIQSSISTQFRCKKNSFYFEQFSLAYVRSLVLFEPIDRTLSDATIPGQSEPGSDGNKGVHRIP